MKKLSKVWLGFAILWGIGAFQASGEKQLESLVMVLLFSSLWVVHEGTFRLKLEYETQDPWYHELLMSGIMVIMILPNRTITTYSELVGLIVWLGFLWFVYRKLFGYRIRYRRKRRAETQSSRELKLPRSQHHKRFKKKRIKTVETKPQTAVADLDRLMHQFEMEYQGMSVFGLAQVGHLYAYHEKFGLAEYPIHQLVLSIYFNQKKTKHFQAFYESIRWEDVSRFLNKNLQPTLKKQFVKEYQDNQENYKYKQAFLTCDEASMILLERTLYFSEAKGNLKSFLTGQTLSDKVLISTFVAYAINAVIVLDRMGKRVYRSHELGTLLYNMCEQFEDIDDVFEKSKELFIEFYQEQLPGVRERHFKLVIASFYENQGFSFIDWTYQSTADLSLGLNMEKVLREKAQQDDFKSASICYECGMMVKQSRDLSKVSPLDLLRFSARLTEFELFYIQQFDRKEKIKLKDRYLNNTFDAIQKEREQLLDLSALQTGTDFEHYLEYLFSMFAYNVKHSGRSGDQGADLVLTRPDGFKYTVQAKFYSSKVGNKAIQEVVGSIKYYGAQQGVVVTNNMYTRSAYNLARANGVIIITGKKLNQLRERALTHPEHEFVDVLASI